MISFSAQISFGQSHKIIKKYKHAKGVTTIGMSTGVFNFLGKFIDIDGVEDDIIKKVKHARIMIVNDNVQKHAITDMQKDFNQLFRQKNFKPLVKIKDGENDVDIIMKQTNGNLIDELIVFINAEDNLVAVVIDGDFTIQDGKKIVQLIQK